MNKTEIVAALADKLELTKKEAETALSIVLDSITEGLKNGEKVVFNGFGTFEVKTRAQRTGRNPQTGEEIVIPASKNPTFKAGKALKDCLK